MSRKMIDYKVEGGNISSIDGYSVGDKITGEALINATKDSTTITRTLDTDGKVKFDAKGGDELTGQVLLDNITKSKPKDGFDYSLSNDGKLIIKAAGRYEYQNFKVAMRVNASAQAYDVGDVIAVYNHYPIANGRFLMLTNTYELVFPPKADRVDSEPVWKIEAYPTIDGSFDVIARCIKAGTLSEDKN